MPEDSADTPQRWTAKRRAALVLSTVKGDTSAQAAARKHGLTVAEIEEWRDRFPLAAENALRARPKDEEALKDEQISGSSKRSVSYTGVRCADRRCSGRTGRGHAGAATADRDRLDAAAAELRGERKR
jgi:transposase-like protein